MPTTMSSIDRRLEAERGDELLHGHAFLLDWRSERPGGASRPAVRATVALGMCASETVSLPDSRHRRDRQPLAYRR